MCYCFCRSWAGAGADADPACSCSLHTLLFEFQYLPLGYVFKETYSWRREFRVEQDRADGGSVPLTCPRAASTAVGNTPSNLSQMVYYNFRKQYEIQQINTK